MDGHAPVGTKGGDKSQVGKPAHRAGYLVTLVLRNLVHKDPEKGTTGEIGLGAGLGEMEGHWGKEPRLLCL